MRRACILGLVLLVAGAGACLWDSDTLKAEAANKMDLVRVITGRFERWPAKYYEVRLERVKKELADSATSDAKRLELYDDGAVALDRLHRDDEAIALIERKKALLLTLDPKVAFHKDHWYRYYANVGTFWAHNWFAKGADRAKIDQLKHARDLIAKAIEINPKAHFGRETYQLYALEWVINPLKTVGYGEDETPLPPNTEIAKATAFTFGAYLARKPREQMTKADIGLGGLILLGNAWESVDIFEALATVTSDQRNTAISLLASERLDELLGRGKKSLIPDFEKPSSLDISLNRNASFIKKEYLRLRLEANQWASGREAFITRRLGEGKHPDVDPDFWEGFVEPKPPELADIPLSKKFSNWAQGDGGPFLLGLVCCAMPVGGIGGIWWYVRRRRRLRAGSPAP